MAKKDSLGKKITETLVLGGLGVLAAKGAEKLLEHGGNIGTKLGGLVAPKKGKGDAPAVGDSTTYSLDPVAAQNGAMAIGKGLLAAFGVPTGPAPAPAAPPPPPPPPAPAPAAAARPKPCCNSCAVGGTCDDTRAHNLAVGFLGSLGLMVFPDSSSGSAQSYYAALDETKHQADLQKQRQADLAAKMAQVEADKKAALEKAIHDKKTADEIADLKQQVAAAQKAKQIAENNKVVINAESRQRVAKEKAESKYEDLKAKFDDFMQKAAERALAPAAPAAAPAPAVAPAAPSAAAPAAPQFVVLSPFGDQAQTVDQGSGMTEDDLAALWGMPPDGSDPFALFGVSGADEENIWTQPLGGVAPKAKAKKPDAEDKDPQLFDCGC